MIGIYDDTGDMLVRYDYDAWGRLRATWYKDDDYLSYRRIANANPIRYKGYYYDRDTGFYYLQSRYYDPVTGRFLNADDVSFIGASGTVLGFNLVSYCEGNPVMREDKKGTLSFYGINCTKKKYGFSVPEKMTFLSRPFCFMYADAFLSVYGYWSWWGFCMRYSGMSRLRIAEELWFHALVYYIGKPIQSILKRINVSIPKLDGWLISASTIDVNSDDGHAWVYSIVWLFGFDVKRLIGKLLPVPSNIITAIIL